jgi:hypothetical protein
VARILRPGARFAFTTWEQPGFSERLKAQQLEDYRAALREAGFAVEVYEEPADWKRQQSATSEAAIANESALMEEMGPVIATRLLAMFRGMLANQASRRYVFGVARRK